MKDREAAVQGLFYQADRARLRADIVGLLQEAPPSISGSPKVLIVPHAGYVYSGRTAAQAYRCVQARSADISRVVVLGPAHRVYITGMALPTVDTFSTPLGQVQLDQEAIAKASELPGVSLCDEAHRLEHSIEVQIPFLQMVLADFILVPIVVGHSSAMEVGAVIDSLWGGPETLIVVSTDLSHFHPYVEAGVLDKLTCERVLAKDNTLAGEDACGANALNGLMSAAHSETLEVQLLHRCNSGDTAGSRAQVVGYGAFILQ